MALWVNFVQFRDTRWWSGCTCSWLSGIPIVKSHAIIAHIYFTIRPKRVKLHVAASRSTQKELKMNSDEWKFLKMTMKNLDDENGQW